MGSEMCIRDRCQFFRPSGGACRLGVSSGCGTRAILSTPSGDRLVARASSVPWRAKSRQDDPGSRLHVMNRGIARRSAVDGARDIRTFLACAWLGLVGDVGSVRGQAKWHPPGRAVPGTDRPVASELVLGSILRTRPLKGVGASAAPLRVQWGYKWSPSSQRGASPGDEQDPSLSLGYQRPLTRA